MNEVKKLPASEQDAAIESLVSDANALATTKRGKFIGWRLPGGFVCRKRRYKDRETAMQAVVEIHRVNHSPDSPDDAYKCEACTGWHITMKAIAMRREKVSATLAQKSATNKRDRNP